MTDSHTQSEMPKAYEPGKIEEKWYQYWVQRGYFTPKIDKTKKPFVVIMPPTNITGELHLGHALTATIEDIMVRWHRMQGDPTLWLPGVDHAGIATQVVVERTLAKEHIDRHQLGREKFLERVWEWANKYRNKIIEEHRRLGASMDWSRLVLPWKKDRAWRYGPPSSACIIKDISIAGKESSTGVQGVPRHYQTWRRNIRMSRVIFII